LAYLAPSETKSFSVFCSLRIKLDERHYRVPHLHQSSSSRSYAGVDEARLVVEIISSDDSPSELLEKVGDYLRANIPHILVVDPYKRKLIEADASGIRTSGSLVVETELTGPLDFAQLFARLDAE